MAVTPARQRIRCKEKGMKKLFLLGIFIFFSNIYSAFCLDLHFTWTLVEFGVENTDVKDNINFNVNLLKFNWFERNTGLGVNISFFNYHHYDEKTYLFFPFALFLPTYWENSSFPAFLIPPIELMWNPIVIKTNKDSNRPGFFNFGIYNRIEYGGRNPAVFEFVDTIGIRFFWSKLPMGRTLYTYENNFNWYISFFSEYSTDRTFRIGISLAI
jgi:hypothetical protein